MADALHLAFSTTGKYLPHTAAMLDSVLARNPDDNLVLHALYGPDLTDEALAPLARWMHNRGARLERHRVSSTLLEGFPDRHFHASVWYRVLLPELLPQASRALYLDSDTIVLDRLRPLWESDLSAHLFAAVVNPLYPFMENWPVARLGLPSEREYPNSGVLLLNLDAMRAAQAVPRIRAYARARPENRFPEQDALAALFHGQCLFLHPRWNVQTTFFDLPPHQLPTPAAQVREAREHPAIVHFIGPFKPDHYLSRHPYGREYLRHRGNTPWPPGDAAGRTPINFLLRRLPLAWQHAYFVGRARLDRLRSH